MNNLVVLHISSISDEKHGGVAGVVPKFVKYQSKYADVALLDIKGTYFKSEGFTKYNYNNYKSILNLPKPFDHPNVVIFHEVYKIEYLRLYKECLMNNIPYIIVPHGCMTKYAQRKKKIKKIFGNFFFFEKFLNNASYIHFLSNIEKEYSKVNVNSFIIGNGYNSEFPLKYNYDKSSNYFIYVGRYDMYHKGLDYLIDACDYAKEWFRDNHLLLRLYGVTERQEKILKQYVANKGIDDFVIVNGPVFGIEKIKLITNSISFVQTSRFEGLPQGISEALVYGVPCIVTSGTAFSDYVLKKKCGLFVEYNNNSIFRAFKYMYENADMREKYSKNALKNSQLDFDWDNIGKVCVCEYDSIVRKIGGE